MPCMISSRQRIVIFELDWTFLRLLVMAGWLRVLVRGDARGLNGRGTGQLSARPVPTLSSRAPQSGASLSRKGRLVTLLPASMPVALKSNICPSSWRGLADIIPA